MPEDLHIESTIIRPSDPEKVIMDKTVCKTETEWWAHEKIKLLDIEVKTLQQKVKDEFDHGKKIATVLQGEITLLNRTINALMMMLTDSDIKKISKATEYYS